MRSRRRVREWCGVVDGGLASAWLRSQGLGVLFWVDDLWLFLFLFFIWLASKRMRVVPTRWARALVTQFFLLQAWNREWRGSESTSMLMFMLISC